MNDPVTLTTLEAVAVLGVTAVVSLIVGFILALIWMAYQCVKNDPFDSPWECD